MCGHVSLILVKMMWRILVAVAVISGENVFGQLKDVSVTVSSTIIERDFMGIGFNLILAHDPNVTNPGSTFYDEVYGKRLREVRPGFVRMNPAINYRTQANRTVLKVLRELEQIGTSVCVDQPVQPRLRYLTCTAFAVN